MRNNPTNPSAVDHKYANPTSPTTELPAGMDATVRKSVSLSMISPSAGPGPLSTRPPSTEIPVYRTFAEFDRAFSFPVAYRLSATQVSVQVPYTPTPDGLGGKVLSPHPPLPEKDGPEFREAKKPIPL